MSDTKKTVVFADFQKQAFARLEEKKKTRYRTLHIPSMDTNIKIKGMSTGEITEITEMDTELDQTRSERYMVYQAVVEPSLKDLATQAKEDGKIQDYLEITDIFEYYEIQEICLQVMELSGYTGTQKVSVVDELKN